MKKIRVMHVIGSLRVGGAETVAMNFYRYIDREKFEFHYIVFGDAIGEYEQEVEKLGGKVFHIHSPKIGYRKFITDIKNIIKENGPYQIIHSHTLFISGIVLYVAHSENIPKRISHAHSDRSVVKYSWHRRTYNFFMKQLIKIYGNKWFSCSEEAGGYVFGEKFHRKNGIIINNGINISDYKFNEQKRIEIRKKYKLEDKFVVGHVGRFSKVKNHEFIIDVFSKINETYKNSVLVLVGDGDQKDLIEKKIKKYNLESKVIVVGTKNNVSDFLNAMDTFLFPSHYEGLGLAVIEAQATGVFCFVSTGIPEKAVISKNIERISLHENEITWAEKIISLSINYKRNKCVVIPEIYDIKKQVRILQELYLEDQVNKFMRKVDRF